MCCGVLSPITDPTLGHPMFVQQCYTSYVLVLRYCVQILLLITSPRLRRLQSHSPDAFQRLTPDLLPCLTPIQFLPGSNLKQALFIYHAVGPQLCSCVFPFPCGIEHSKTKTRGSFSVRESAASSSPGSPAGRGQEAVRSGSGRIKYTMMCKWGKWVMLPGPA